MFLSLLKAVIEQFSWRFIERWTLKIIMYGFDLLVKKDDDRRKSLLSVRWEQKQWPVHAMVGLPAWKITMHPTQPFFKLLTLWWSPQTIKCYLINIIGINNNSNNNKTVCLRPITTTIIILIKVIIYFIDGIIYYYYFCRTHW